MSLQQPTDLARCYRRGFRDQRNQGKIAGDPVEILQTYLPARDSEMMEMTNKLGAAIGPILYQSKITQGQRLGPDDSGQRGWMLSAPVLASKACFSKAVCARK